MVQQLVSAEQQRRWEKNMDQYHIAHHGSHIMSLGIEPDTPEYQARFQQPGLWSSQDCDRCTQCAQGTDMQIKTVTKSYMLLGTRTDTVAKTTQIFSACGQIHANICSAHNASGM